MSLRFTVATAALLGLAAIVPEAAQAQVELGVDLGASFRVNSPTVTMLSVPTGTLRAGFTVGERVSVEPQVNLQYVKVENSDGVTALDGILGVLYHFSTDQTRSRVYVRPFGGVTWLHASGSSVSQWRLGGGVGVMLPAPGNMSWRIEGNFAHGFSNNNFDKTDVIGLTFGVSFTTP